MDWLPENHLVFFLLDMAAELDLSTIYAVYEARDPRGVKAYDPRMMVVLLLYAYCVGIPSSCRIVRACWEDAAFRVLTGNQQADYSRISDFRLEHLDALADLLVQVLRLCQKAGLVSLGNESSPTASMPIFRRVPAFSRNTSTIHPCRSQAAASQAW